MVISRTYVSLPEGKFCEFSRIPSSVEVLGHGLESMVLGLSVIRSYIMVLRQ